ncbi:MAG: thioredoxin TrxC [Gammaproteobacteria bacterium]|nr:thioredoxin TrxC [Gammaproteobacteria bacterium]MDH5800268.1 thioredoxin TrxC [Gammaproteobacteria bacterium]
MVHVVCPACDAVNRLPEEKLGAGGKCGACHRPLFTGQVLELNNARFQKHIQKSQLPIVVDFWASWCGPCKMMAPVFAQLAQELEPQFRLVKVNTETEQALAAQFNIRSIPSLLLFENGIEKARIAGAMDKQNLLAWIQQNR